MTNEESSTAASGMPDGGPVIDSRGIDFAEATMDRFLGTADISRAYGDPIQHGDHLIIPTAEVVAVMGFGGGSGGGTGQESDNAFGSGGGGGGNAFSRPVAVIVAGPNGVEVTPILDTTKVALTALTAFGFMLATLSRFRKGPKA